MPLTRFYKTFSLLNTSVDAGYTTAEIDISKSEFIGIYVESNVANTFTIQVNTGNGYKDYDSLSVSAGLASFFNIWSLPFSPIKIKVANAATVSIEVYLKT